MPASVSVLQLVKRKDADNSDINSVDLMSLPIELQYEGWQQATPQQQGQPSVDDVITLLMNAGDDNALAMALQSIDTKVKEVQWAQDPLNPIGVWLRSRLSSETNARQAFILAARRSPALQVTDPLAYDSILQKYQLGITRAPVWENVLQQQIPASPGAISIHGGTIAYTVAGDAHARIAKVAIDGGSGGAKSEVWLGVKSNRYGVNPANFIPVWHLRSNFYTLVSDSSSVADATALDGYKQQCTFATVPTMDYRSVMRVGGVTTNYVADQRGKYIVLMRVKTSDASTAVNVRVGQGYTLSTTQLSAFAWKPRLKIGPNANTGWRYYTIGQVTIPATGGVFEQLLKSASIAIQAERIAGSGNLDMDNLVLIPAEHCIHVATTLSNVGATTNFPLYILTRPDHRIYAVFYVVPPDDTIEDAPPPDEVNWSIPSGSGVIVCAGSLSQTTVSDTFVPTFYVYPSYSSLRGSS